MTVRAPARSPVRKTMAAKAPSTLGLKRHFGQLFTSSTPDPIKMNQLGQVPAAVRQAAKSKFGMGANLYRLEYKGEVVYASYGYTAQPAKFDLGLFNAGGELLAHGIGYRDAAHFNWQ